MFEKKTIKRFYIVITQLAKQVSKVISVLYIECYICMLSYSNEMIDWGAN